MSKTKQNSSGSILPRLSGVAGTNKLIEILQATQIVSGDENIAKELVSAGSIEEIRIGKNIIIQGNTDNDIYIIISGKFDIRINERKIASRFPGQTIGEMALIDSVALRSATVEATEKSIVLRITETKFVEIANKYPGIWRRLAVELAARLRQRNAYVKQPRSQPVIFIASSSEGLEVAQRIKKKFDVDPFITNIWTDGVFKPSSTAIEDLVNSLENSDYAIIVITPDDIVTSRSITKSSPRDNVLFEFGLFIGSLGRERTFFIHEKGLDIKIPSDLLGVNGIIYNPGKKNSINQRITPCIEIIRKRINELGPI